MFSICEICGSKSDKSEFELVNRMDWRNRHARNEAGNAATVLFCDKCDMLPDCYIVKTNNNITLKFDR